MSGRRTAFEQFWSAKLGRSINEARSTDMDLVKERKRELRDEFDLPAGFKPADAPIGSKLIFNQKQELSELAEFANNPNSALGPDEWVDIADPKLSKSENIERLEMRGGRPGEEATEQENIRTARALQDEAERAARDFLVGVCEDVLDAGGDGVAALQTALAGEVPDQPGIDASAVRDSVQDIAEEFDQEVIEQAITECRLEQRDQAGPTGAPTPTDRQGRPIRPVGEVVDNFVSTLETDGISEAREAATDIELRQVADAAGDGQLSATDRSRLITAVEQADEDALGAAADDSDPIFDLLFELDVRIPPPPQPDLTQPDAGPAIEEVSDEALDAADRVEMLLEQTPTRGLEHFERLVLALESGDAVPGLPLTSDTIDALTPRDQSRFLERARGIRDQLSAARLTLDDLPSVQRLVTTPASGKRRSNFWIPVRDELTANDEYPTLADPPGSIRGAPNDELNRLNLADRARTQALQEVRDQIDRLGDDGGGGGIQFDEGTAVAEEEGVGSIDLGDIIDAGAGRVADRTVPPAERTDWTTGEDWTASPEQVALERDFVEWAHQTKPNNRWDTAEFQARPENRERSMQEWAVLQVQAGNGTVDGALKAGLPADWFQET